MPIAGSSTYALVIVSLGILGVIVSFLVADRRKYFIALALSLFVIAMGLFEFVDSSLNHWRTARRIAKLQETQRLNLESLQSKLREASEKAHNGPVPAPAPNRATTSAAPAPVAAKPGLPPVIHHRKK